MRSNGQYMIRLVISLLWCSAAEAQPVLSTKRKIEGYEIYQDHHNKRLFYYSPPEIALKTDNNGMPAFTLLQMRYTGTHLYSDKDFKGFLNLLQLTVDMAPVTPEAFGKIKTALGRGAELKPMPVRQFNAELIIPLGDSDAANEKYRKVSAGGVDAAGETGSGNVFWRERTFTMRLENYEAQLLWDQVETGKLGISFSYAFYADAIPGQVGKAKYSGAGDFAKEMEEGMPEGAVFDSTLNTYLVKANTFPIYIDPARCPECLKKVDINEEMPPAYASFEVRCYDFSDGLRPDLFKKIVEIKAFGAAKEYISVKTDFSRNKPDLSSQVARFKYAIRLDHPLEYRVTEINVNGEKTVSQWMPRQSWSEVIDVTTPAKENRIGKRSLDIELSADSLVEKGFASGTCQIAYMLNGQPVQQSLTWEAEDENPLKHLAFMYDRDQPVRYRFVVALAEGDISTPFKALGPEEEYVFYMPEDD